jgi:DNA-binding MarR family transcriptional regulator
VGQLYDDVLAPSGLRATQYTLLAALARHVNPPLGDLAADLVMDRSALAHTLAPLIVRGLAAFEPDAADRRLKRIRLTAKGRALLEEAEPLWRRAEDHFEAVFGVAAAHDLRRLLDQIAEPEFATQYRQRTAPA